MYEELQGFFSTWWVRNTAPAEPGWWSRALPFCRIKCQHIKLEQKRSHKSR